MEEPESGFEIVKRSVARNDDRHALPRLILQRGQNERPSLDREAGRVERLRQEALKLWSPRELGTELGDEGVVAGQSVLQFMLSREDGEASPLEQRQRS